MIPAVFVFIGEFFFCKNRIGGLKESVFNVRAWMETKK